MSRFSRFVSLLFAAVQFALPAVASVADGATAAGGRNSAAHVESKGDRDCKPPHTADCAICRFLSTTHSKAAAATPPVVARLAAPTRETAVAVATAAPGAGFDSRAPPAILD